MKAYTKPEVEIKTLTSEAIMAPSGGINLTKFTKASEGKGYNVIENF